MLLSALASLAPGSARRSQRRGPSGHGRRIDDCVQSIATDRTEFRVSAHVANRYDVEMSPASMPRMYCAASHGQQWLQDTQGSPRSVCADRLPAGILPHVLHCPSGKDPLMHWKTPVFVRKKSSPAEQLDGSVVPKNAESAGRRFRASAEINRARRGYVLFESQDSAPPAAVPD